MATQTPSSKQSAVSATGSMPKSFTRYSEDPFFRTTTNIILLQTIFILIVCFVFSFAVRHQQDASVEALRTHVESIRFGETPAAGSLTDSFTDVRYETLSIVLVVLIVLTIVFGYLTARYALAPTRDTRNTQRRFIGNLAHELRTPLAVMRTDTEVALMHPKLSADVRKTLESTLEELDRASEIINNLLTFNSLLRPGQVTLTPIDLIPVLTCVRDRHQELADSRGISLFLELPENVSSVWINGNAVALEQVFTNLVKNALNYTPHHDDRLARVRLGLEDERISITVTDTGIGIAQKDLYHVFEPFYRGDTSRARRVGGGTSGLGLAIVNDIVRAHQGSIVIRSALNRGTTIEISFPRITETHPVTLPEEDDQEHEASIVSSKR